MTGATHLSLHVHRSLRYHSRQAASCAHSDPCYEEVILPDVTEATGMYVSMARTMFGKGLAASGSHAVWHGRCFKLARG